MAGKIKSEWFQPKSAITKRAEYLRDFIGQYPCQVCGREFQSARELATHPHVSRKAGRD